MRKFTTPILFCSALAVTGMAQAAQDMKPGLWKVNIQSNEMKKMPKISPQQAAMMKRMGINVPSQSNGGMTTKICFTQKMIENDQVADQESGDCKTTNVRQNGSSYAADIICNSPDLKGNGTVKGTYNSNRFNSTYRFKGTSHGRKVNKTQTSNGQWLGSNCGSVKPFSQ